MKKNITIFIFLFTNFFCFAESSAQFEQLAQYIEMPTELDQEFHQPIVDGKFEYNVYGYVKHAAWVDSYQVAGFVQNYYIFFPREYFGDACGRNIRQKGQSNMLDIESRIRAEIAGPKIGRADTYAILEADFRGGDLEDYINIFRMLHGHMYFNWGDQSLLIGQYWHPIFTADAGCYAPTISYSYGLPFDPYTLEPQIRYTRQLDNITWSVTAASHSTRFYDGPIGLSTIYARNAVMPNFNFRAFAIIGKHRIGFSADANRLVPRLVTDKDICVTESLMSYLGLLFCVFDWDSVILRSKVIFAQNGNGYLMLGGYGVHCVNPYTDERSYSNINSISAWSDVTVRSFPSVEPGLFIGYTKNLGASSAIVQNIDDQNVACCGVPAESSEGETGLYSFGTERLDYIFRIAPRIRWYKRPFSIGAELEYTRAAFGDIGSHGQILNPRAVGNTRLMMAGYYYF